MKTIDLTTLQGWNDLPDGTYDITVGATAEGYTRIKQSSAVSVVKETPQEYFLTFSSPNSFTLDSHETHYLYDTQGEEVEYEERDGYSNWDGTLEYSTDKITWSIWDASQLTAVNDGISYKLYLRGTSNTHITSYVDEYDEQDYNTYNEYRFKITGSDVSCIGNIENLLDYSTVINGQHPIMGENCFELLFYENSALVSAPELPATILADSCYTNMFTDCTSLTQAPQLPATTLVDFCYGAMFVGCTSLTTAPALPATTMEYACYASMFADCTSLTQAPQLPATTLADRCYATMFSGCTSLTQVPALPATTLTTECYRYMFRGCTSLYVSDAQTAEAQYEWGIPSNGVITGTDNYQQDTMFEGCLGTRSSDTLAGEVGQQYIYYTQNQPVGNN